MKSMEIINGVMTVSDSSGYTYTEKNDYKTLWERMDGKNVIYIDSLSNTIAPSMKIAYFVASEDIVERFFKMRTYYSKRLSQDLADKTLQIMPQNTYVVGFGELRISEIKATVGLWEKAWKQL